MIDKTQKTKIIVHRQKDGNYLKIISIGWKKIGKDDVRGDYITITEDLIPELIKELELIKKGNKPI